MPGAAAEDAKQACGARDCENAIHLWEKAVGSQPHDYELHFQLGLCYGGLCERHPLVHPDMAVAYLRHALRLTEAAPKRVRVAIVDQLGDTLCHSGSDSGTAALRAAIECQVEAAEMYQSLGMTEDWGRIQFNLGNSCCDLSEIAGEDHWQEAVFHYRESLRVRTREKDPERHAAVLENLGSAYRRLSVSGTGEPVKESIRCYRRALRIYAVASRPEKSAALENNLGNAFLSLPDSDRQTNARNARRALRHFDRALGMQSRNKGSRAYGITQYNRAQAYCRMALTSADANPKIAVLCLEESFAAFQACGDLRYTQLVRAQLERIRRQ